MYFVTGAQRFSYFFAVVFNTILNVVFLKGIGLLLVGIVPFIEYFNLVFALPHYIGMVGIGIILYFVNLKVVPFHMLDYANMVKTKYVKLIIYVVLCIVLFLYPIFIHRYFE